MTIFRPGRSASPKGDDGRPRAVRGFSMGAVLVLVLLSGCSGSREGSSENASGWLSYGGNIAYGLPGGEGVLLDKSYFVVLFDTSDRIPRWVSYRLTPAEFQGTARRTDDFRADPELPEAERSELEDYRGSSYDRGHMAPAADFTRSREAMSATFLLSNMAPQRPSFNRGRWARLEAEVRSFAEQSRSTWIVTGSLFLDSLCHPTLARVWIGPHRVAVPTHFYKVILAESDDGALNMYAFVMANDSVGSARKTGEALVSVDSVETLSGLDFFREMSDERESALEKKPAESWASD